MLEGAARLDAAGGLIVGYALAKGARPARVRALVNGAQVAEGVAASPVSILTRKDGARPWFVPPTPICAFALKLPGWCAEKLPEGGTLEVVAFESGVADEIQLLQTSFDGVAALACFIEGFEMADSLTLEISRLRAGTFSGRVRVHHNGAAPDIRLRVRGQDLGAAQLTRTGPQIFALEAALPPAAVDDGVSVVEFALPNGEVLARYPLSAGTALEGDLAAEVGSLRAELDQLKTAFRGAMAGGVITRDERPMIIAETLTQVDNILEMRDRADRFERVEFDDPADDADEFDWDIEA